MEYRRLGNSGLEISVIGLGTAGFGRRVAREIAVRLVHEAVEQGINYLDTADSYGDSRQSEKIVGQAAKGIRHQVLIGTKIGRKIGKGPNAFGASRQHIVQGVETSLQVLGTDYIDLYQIHRPDSLTPIEETLRALDDLVRMGKVRYIGCSNYAAWQVGEAVWTSRAQHLVPFISVQAEYNMLVRDAEKELTPVCSQYGLGILPYAPLAGGFLTGRYRRGHTVGEGNFYVNTRNKPERFTTDAGYQTLEELGAFARVRGRSLIDLSFAWLLANPQVGSVITGASKVEQVRKNAKAWEWRLAPEEKADVDVILGGAA